MATKDQLDIPSAAKEDPNSFELMRIWIAKKNQYVSLRSGVWSDPAAWGLMLADLVRHVANTFEQTESISFDEAVVRIRSAFEAESNSPTDLPSGKILSDDSSSDPLN